MLEILVIIGVVVVVAAAAALGRRMERIARGLEEVARDASVRDLATRVDSLEQSLAGSDPKDHSPALERLERDLREVLHRLEETASAREVRSLHDTVEDELRGQGYESVRFLGDPPGEAASGECKVGVEAVRGGMRYKGHVLVRPGQRAEPRLRPIHGMFP